MAHFAKLNDENIVTEVIVINNDALDSDNEEISGKIFLATLFNDGAKWVQTSYSGAIRYNYAGLNYLYDAENDAFIPPKPLCDHPELTLDTTVFRWTCGNAEHEVIHD
jgi:hypothetical protein